MGDFRFQMGRVAVGASGRGPVNFMPLTFPQEKSMKSRGLSETKPTEEGILLNVSRQGIINLAPR